MNNYYNLRNIGNRYFFSLLFGLLIYSNSFSQNIYEDYQDGIICFKLKKEANLLLPSDGEKVNLNDAFFLKEIIRQFKIDKLVKPNFFFTGYEPIQRIFRLEFSDHFNVDKLIEALNNTGVVEYAAKIPVFRSAVVENAFNPLALSPNAFVPYAVSPNDPSFSKQWFLTKINAPAAWDYVKGDPKITVAIVDNGVALNHEDLKDNIWVNPGEIAGNGIDDDNNGFKDDINGYDVGDNDNNPSPASSGTEFWHGTHTSGLAGAVSDNAKGIASIGYNIRIIAVKGATNSNSGQTNFGLDGLAYASSVGARVISCSWGGYISDPASIKLITDYVSAAVSKKCLLIFAAGNAGTADKKFYPAACDSVVAVASTETNDTKSNFSNWASWVDISCPGRDLYSTMAASGYANQSGTSMATPLVAGLCGLMLSLNPKLNPAQVKACLFSSAVNIDALNPNYKGKLGAGRIDAAAALKCVAGTLTTSIADHPFENNLSVYPNPTQGTVFIGGLTTNSPAMVKIFDRIGLRVLIQQVDDIRSFTGELDLSQLPDGLYILQIRSGDNIYYSKIIKQ